LSLALSSDDFTNPLDIANLLFLEFEEGLEHSEVELRELAAHEHLHLLVEDQVLQSHFDVALFEVLQQRVRVRHALEHFSLHGHVLDQVAQLLESLAGHQAFVLVGLELADAGHEALLVGDALHEEPVLDKLDGHAVRLEPEDLVHVEEGLAPDALAFFLEVLDPQLLEQQAHSLRVLGVHLLEDRINVLQPLEFLRLLDLHVELLAQGTVSQHCLLDQPLVSMVQLGQLLELVDVTHGVCRGDQLLGVDLVLDAVEDVDHVVDHVGYLAGEQEGVEWLVRVGDEEVPLVLELVGDLGAHDVHGEVLHDFAHEVLVVRVGQEGLDVGQALGTLHLFVLFRFDEGQQEGSRQ